MLIHVVVALAPIAAVAYLFCKLQLQFYTFDRSTWAGLSVFSLVMMFLVAIPSTLTGVFERGHMYAKWHSTHKLKLVLSLALVCALLVELLLLLNAGLEGALFSLLGVMIIILNNVLTFFLCVYGLKITLGRQSLERTSYTPDLFKEEPFDILVSAGEHRKEEPKYLDLLTER